MMNERIKKLVELAGISVRGYYDETGSTPLELQKFAQLIVRECVRYFNEDYQRDFDSLWREDLSKGIKQHFGVEE